MNFLLPLSIVLSLLLLEFVLLLLRKKRECKPKEQSKLNQLDNRSPCLEVEDCWCCEYNLSKEKKEEILKEFGDLYCGKSVESMLKNE